MQRRGVLMPQIISQRLTRLFQIMLEKNSPISVGELANVLEVSRRTIFRELENVDNVLNKYNLTLETSVKEGLFLKGEKEDVEKFTKMIDASKSASLINKEERRTTLAFALLNSTEWEKLYYFSSILQVSEATVSLDLDFIQRELEQFQLLLNRKKGVGVLIEGTERNIRSAMVYYMSKHNNNEESFSIKYDFPPNEIEHEVKKIIKFLSIHLDWITSDTIKMLEFWLCVQIVRVRKNCFVSEQTSLPKTSMLWQTAQRIADELKGSFAVEMPESEVQLIALTLSATRAKQKKPISEEEEAAAYNRVRNLAFLLIENFDERIAPALKTNEEFVRGLSVHLYSAIRRIKSGYIIADPLSQQIKETYPDIYNKTIKAAAKLEKDLNRKVPEGEIACLAAHFGAAVMQIGQDKLKRKLKVGIVCIGGIGVSYMLNSQVKKRFSNEIITEISEYNQKEQWEENDFIISTIPLEFSGMPIVNVSPILSQKDYDNIRSTIENLKAQSFKTVKLKGESLIKNVEKSRLFLKEIQSILNNFNVINASDSQTVEDLAKFLGYRFGTNTENGEIIYNSLMQRERISTQVIESLNLLLLHCTTEGIIQPIISIITNGKYGFVNTKGQKAQTCLAIIVPKNSTAQIKETIGLICSELVENDDFLNTILMEDESDIYIKLEELLQGKLSNYFADIFK